MSAPGVIATSTSPFLGKQSLLIRRSLDLCAFAGVGSYTKGSTRISSLFRVLPRFEKCWVSVPLNLSALSSVWRSRPQNIAVNNAGTVGTPGSAADVTPESYQAIFDTNVLGVLLCMKYEIRAMLWQRKGSIVNISSSYGKVGGPTAAVYVGSKHAVEGITKSAAIELAGTGVRVNIVGPGPTETGMFNRFAQTKENKANFLETHIPTKRMGAPEEIANAILFIASDKASYIVGASLAVDGGMLAG
jgi:NAD(P)-dependent dehydrogenase (short-subunit alcohol dehydrogenase family)